MIRLGELASARSGDKGNHANVAVFAKSEAAFRWLREQLSERLVASYFEPLGVTRVVRFEAPNVLALNFLLLGALAGGASRSLRIDTQGKTLGLALLELRLPCPPEGTET
jgi:hypothetical protein